MAATIGICVAIIGMLLMGIVHFRSVLRSGCCGSGGDPAPKRVRVRDRGPNHYPYEKVLDIHGMTCKNCAAHVQNALNSLGGVFARVDLGRKKAVVHMKSDLPEGTLRQAVAGAGYSVGSIHTVVK